MIVSLMAEKLLDTDSDEFTVNKLHVMSPVKLN